MYLKRAYFKYGILGMRVEYIHLRQTYLSIALLVSRFIVISQHEMDFCLASNRSF